MGITELTNYTYSHADTKRKKVTGSTENTTDKQNVEKSYSHSQEYKNYLTNKYDCLTSKNYFVRIDSSFLSKAAGDEEKAKWLEHNLSLIPQIMDNIRSAVASRRSQIISCNITINGYDSMTTQLCTKSEADPGTEKAREKLKERLEKKMEEKKAKEQRDEKEKQYQTRIDGKDVADLMRKIKSMVPFSDFEAIADRHHSTLDVKA